MTVPVLFEEHPAANGTRIGIATLNAEKSLNALSLDMVHLLTGKLHAWAGDASIALVILQAAGEKAFCAGGDLHNLYRSMREHHASDARGDVVANRYAADFFGDEYRLDYLIHTYSKPVLCWGHGIVMGGGVGLMSGASHRVVTEQSRVAMPEISIGLYPDVGGSWLLSRMPGKTGLFLALTGAQVRAADALFVGLADYALPQSSKASVLEALLQQAWTAQRRDNDALLSQVLRRFADPALAVPGPLQKHFAAINALCGDTDIRRIAAAIAANDIDDAWLHKASATLAAGSPSSAALAHALLQRAQGMLLADVFRMEYIASLHCAARHDFAEGIRALLIDKDGKPQWEPASLEDVAPETLGSYFAEPAWNRHPLADL
ncbi:enoyl-CoA hydratase/isomerase family protein [Noviherbaspirillum sedimenti]|uniref:3-hydroxyisobutyryl-CoA hydrolase n=1 Tax=Noviherbaspirillum sedimenti TaxID=2320865 RepID=A0A3A3GC32_9BURK|nr:enoyl-CoA hydratase/isomerase family protein [Noviherbaspirillum sedimenti]RJG04222.1 enoyl-CoA hydratase/isomerase family protein [Noviherbaspirillum sedimenti]